MENKNLNRSLNLIVKSAIIVFIAVLTSKILGYAYRIIIARYYGPEVYGTYSLAIIITGWFITFAMFGMGEGILRNVSLLRGKKKIDGIRHLFRASSIMLLIISIISGTLLFFLAEPISLFLFNNADLAIFLKFFSVIVPLTIFFNIFLEILQAYEIIGWHAFVSDFLLNFLKVAFLLALIFIGFNSNAVIFSYILGTFITLLIVFLVMKRKIPEIFKRPSSKDSAQPRLLKELFSYSWPLLLGRILWDIFHWADSFLIGYYMGPVEVGIYNAALPIAFLLTIPPWLFMRLFHPLISREYAAGNKGMIKELSKQVVKWTFILTLPLFILMALFPEAFLNIFFGEDYLSGKWVLVLLSISFMLSSILNIPPILLRIIGKTKTFFFDTLFFALLNVMLNVLFIPRYGLNGAAFATMLSTVALYLIFMVQVYFYMGIIPLKLKMLNIVIAGVIPAVLLKLLKEGAVMNIYSLVSLSLFFFISYILLILLFKGLDENDISIIKTSIRKLRSIKIQGGLK